jgi:hypothetical protein
VPHRAPFKDFNISGIENGRDAPPWLPDTSHWHITMRKRRIPYHYPIVSAPYYVKNLKSIESDPIDFLRFLGNAIAAFGQVTSLTH